MKWRLTHRAHFLGVTADRWPVDAVNSVVQTTRITQIVARAVTPPQGCHAGAAVHTFLYIHP